LEKREAPGKVKSPLEQYDNVESAPLPPIAPDGGFAPGAGVGMPSSAPPADPEHFVCLRGPCRHYWELVTYMGAGNPEDTWAELGIREPRQINRSCLAHSGTETELTENCVFACNLWDPLSPREARKREKRRERHFRRYPEHRSIEDEATIAGIDDEEIENGT
jgi:hypothetical protein